MKAKGRARGPYLKGERHPGAKLILADVKLIRALYSAGDISQREIADQFGVTRSAISGVIYGTNWGWDAL